MFFSQRIGLFCPPGLTPKCRQDSSLCCDLSQDVSRPSISHGSGARLPFLSPPFALATPFASAVLFFSEARRFRSACRMFGSFSPPSRSLCLPKVRFYRVRSGKKVPSFFPSPDVRNVTSPPLFVRTRGLPYPHPVHPKASSQVSLFLAPALDVVSPFRTQLIVEVSKCHWPFLITSLLPQQVHDRRPFLLSLTSARFFFLGGGGWGLGGGGGGFFWGVFFLFACKKCRVFC